MDLPRRERPLDEGGGVAVGFAAQLRQLRDHAGKPGYRELARRAHFSASTLSAAASGHRLPSLEVTLAFVRACGGDEDEWRRRWEKAATVLAAPPEVRGPPYLGLTAFRPEDAEWFFGREQLTEQLTARVARQRFVAVLGASGSGKSSLLGAGLVAAARAGRVGDGQPWQVTVITPAAYCQATDELTLPVRPEVESLLVVDQFEEVFTLCHDGAARSAFIQALLTAATAPDSRTRVVIGVRTDFFTHCCAHSDLAAAMQNAQFLVGPMTAGDMRQAIVRPATRAGCMVEGDLVAELVAEAADQPRTLPLVSHALLQTYRRRRGRILTLAGYRTVGGVQGAAARTAEHCYGTLLPGQQEIARDLFLRLTALGEGTEDTKRRVTVAELARDDPDLTVVLDRYVAARLVTLDGDTVEIAHEALIRSWPRLRDWLTTDRDGLRVHRQLTEAAEGWESLDRDPGALYRGVRLATALEWRTRAQARLSPAEQTFLDVSATADRDERRRVRRVNRRLRRLTAALTVLLLTAVGISVVAVRQRQEAVTQQQIAVSRQLAAQAQEIASRDAGKATRWALEAYRAHPTVEARSVLLSVASRPSYSARLPQPATLAALNWRVAFSPDGRYLASTGATPYEVALWDTATRRRAGDLPQVEGANFLAFAFSADGTRLAATGTTGVFVVWDVARREVVHQYRVDGADDADVAISPDLRLVAAVGEDGGVRVRDTANGDVVASWDGQAGTAVAFSADGQLLATAGVGGTITLWHTGSHERVDLPAGGADVSAVAFSADGRLLATATVAGTISLWDLASRTRVASLTDHVGPVLGLAFHPTAPVLISTGQDKRMTMWDTAGHGRLVQLSIDQSPWLGAVTVSRDGDTIAVPAEQGVRLWDLADLPLIGHTGPVDHVAFADSGELFSLGADEFAAWSGAIATPTRVPAFLDAAFDTERRRLVLSRPDGTVTTWDLDTRESTVQAIPEAVPLMDIALSPTRPVLALDTVGGTLLWDLDRAELVGEIPARYSPERPVSGFTFTPDGRTLIVSDTGQPVRLWDVAAGAVVGELPPRGELRMAVDPRGELLAVSGTSGTVQLWDLNTRTKIADLPGHTGEVNALEFAGGGRLLATTGNDRKVILWDLATHTRWATLSGHTEEVVSAAWRRDGTRLATGSRDHTVTTWLTDPEEAARHLCDRLTQDFPTEPATVCDR